MKNLLCLAAALAVSSPATVTAADQMLKLAPGATVEIPHSSGKFDFLRVDSKRHRLLAAHENDGTADYIDLQKNSLITRLKVGGAVDTAVDQDSKFYYVSVQEAQRVAVVDAETLMEVKSIKTSGPTDAIIFEPKNHMVYVTYDEGADVWVIDPAGAKVVATVTIPGVPEFMVYDDQADRMSVVSTAGGKVASLGELATAPTARNVAVDPATRAVWTTFTDGTNSFAKSWLPPRP